MTATEAMMTGRLPKGATPDDRERQVLRFEDPATGSEVVLVGCMHFNPCSVEKSARVTRELAEQGRLGAVVIESCPTRWETTCKLAPTGSAMRSLLDNEMQAAAEAAEASGCRVVLGDQRVEDLSEQVGGTARRTLVDLATPLDGGWQRMAEEVATGVKDVVKSMGKSKGSDEDGKLRLEWKKDGGISMRMLPKQEGGEQGDAQKKDDGASSTLGPQDLLDPDLAKGLPVSVARYLLSAFIKAPLVSIGFASSVAFLAFLPENLFTDLLSLVVELLIFRVVLSSVLRNRDDILAQSVADACKASGGPGRAVVAVLGAAHCNGVRQRVLQASEA